MSTALTPLRRTLRYVMDDRFKENNEKQSLGLAQFIHDAFIADSVDNI